MTKEGRSLWNVREESAQGVKRRFAEKFEAKRSESQAKQIAMQVGRKLATKTKKDRNGKDEDGDGDRVDEVLGFPDRRASCGSYFYGDTTDSCTSETNTAQQKSFGLQLGSCPHRL